jgi:hypothetical protein
MKKGVKILIIVLCLIIVGLVTFIVVDKVVNTTNETGNQSSDNVVTNSTNNTIKSTNTQSSNTTTKNESTNYNEYDEDGLIILNSSSVEDKNFYRVWSNTKDTTEVEINENGTFIYNHDTKINGTYKIDGVNITFYNEDGTSWKGTIRAQDAGNYVLKITKDGVSTILYSEEGD